MVYEDEIPRELEVDKIYTSHELYHFVATYDDVLVLSDDTQSFSNHGNQKFKVKEISDQYLHQGTNGNTYIIPSKQQKVVFVSKV